MTRAHSGKGNRSPAQEKARSERNRALYGEKRQAEKKAHWFTTGEMTWRRGGGVVTKGQKNKNPLVEEEGHRTTKETLGKLMGVGLLTRSDKRKKKNREGLKNRKTACSGRRGVHWGRKVPTKRDSGALLLTRHATHQNRKGQQTKKRDHIKNSRDL